MQFLPGWGWTRKRPTPFIAVKPVHTLRTRAQDNEISKTGSTVSAPLWSWRRTCTLGPGEGSCSGFLLHSSCLHKSPHWKEEQRRGAWYWNTLKCHTGKIKLLSKQFWSQDFCIQNLNSTETKYNLEGLPKGKPIVISLENTDLLKGFKLITSCQTNILVPSNTN